MLKDQNFQQHKTQSKTISVCWQRIFWKTSKIFTPFKKQLNSRCSKRNILKIARAVILEAWSSSVVHASKRNSFTSELPPKGSGQQCFPSSTLFFVSWQFWLIVAVHCNQFGWVDEQEEIERNIGSNCTAKQELNWQTRWFTLFFEPAILRLLYERMTAKWQLTCFTTPKKTHVELMRTYWRDVRRWCHSNFLMSLKHAGQPYQFFSQCSSEMCSNSKQNCGNRCTDIILLDK